MSRDIINVPLGAAAPGTDHSVQIVRYGLANTGQKVYVHAALHADEVPGLLVLHHLLELLDAANARGEIQGQIVVVPYANPLGLSQFINGDHLGRFDLASGRNFNRGWHDLSSELISRLQHDLGNDVNENLKLIRTALREILKPSVGTSPVDSLNGVLLAEAVDADLVLDLHCDDEGLMHVFMNPAFWPDLQDLAADLGCRAVFGQRGTTAGTFIEACVEPWVQLAAAFPEKAIPIGCKGATIELRGFTDVDDDTAHADAVALMNAMQRRGILTGPAVAAPEPQCAMTDFAACDIVRAPKFGVVVYRVALGERVRSGQPIADIIDPSCVGREARTPVVARTDGIVLTRKLKKLVAAGQAVAKIVGDKPLPHRTGYLLED